MATDLRPRRHRLARRNLLGLSAILVTTILGMLESDGQGATALAQAAPPLQIARDGWKDCAFNDVTIGCVDAPLADGISILGRQITSLIGKEKLLKTSVSAASDPSQRPELLDDYLLEARSAAGMTKVLFSDLADTKFDHKPPIADNELLPPWAQKYQEGWLSSPKSASPKAANTT